MPFRSILLAAAIGLPQCLAAQSGVTVTFLANEGVMLSAGNKKVLIDALFEKYGSGYAIVADSTRVAMDRARAPFDAVDLILVTHRHGDHFHPTPMGVHLAANPRATLLTSQQVIDSLRGGFPGAAALAPRLVARTTAPGTRRRETVNGIAVELLGFPHGSARHRTVEHLAYIVEIGGRRVLHTGDAELTEEIVAPFRLDTARIDVALIPAWSIENAKERAVIERWIRPKQVVAIHVAEGQKWGDEATTKVRAAMPAAVTFWRSLEVRRW